MHSLAPLRSRRNLFLFAAALTSVALSQTASSRAAFEVASVKPSATETDKAYVQALPGRLLMQNFSPRTLILLAYGVADYQISGGPSWIASEHYDLQAKAEGNASVQQMEGPMLQALLEDRFKLAFHREKKQLPAYELKAANGNGKLQPSKNDSCTPYSVNSPAPPARAPGEPRPAFCGFPRFAANGLNRTLDGAGINMAELAASLSRSQLHLPVIDKTGLTGTFDVHLEWTVDASNSPAGGAPSDGPSIFTALREQLGLQLKSAKGAIEVIAIDRVEKPSAN